MSLLELERVGKSSGGTGAPAVLREVSLELEAGELAVVWGMRRSGRSTLLRVAAGIEPPDRGVVRFEGKDLAEHAEALLGKEIGYCQKRLRGEEGRGVVGQVMIGLLVRGVSPAQARRQALDALERVGVGGCAALALHELDGAEAIRVALARTLALGPRLLVVDEPTKGVDLLARDELLLLLRSLADEGLTILMSADESTALSGADRAFSLSEGELRGTPARELAPVVELRPAQRRLASG
jgi:energy-coupling factor transporter ATP-binding protein EcfA2